MNSLTWELCNSLPTDRRTVIEQVVFEIFGCRKERGDQSPNFEELLNYLDTRSFTYLEGCGIDLSAVSRAQAVEIVLQGLREFIREKCRSVRSDLGPYDSFVSSLEPDATVVSFNWDVLLELSLIKAGKSFRYLPGGAGLYILLLKPHGSINWFALLDRELLMIDTSTSNVDVIGSSLKYYMLYLKDPLAPVEMGSSSPLAKNAVSKVPAIVPPSSAKLLDVGGEPRDDFVDNGHRQALREVWKEFYDRVKAAAEIVVVGYSLPGPDAASIEVLKAFRKPSKKQRVSIIDKNLNVLTRYRSIVHPGAILVGDDFKVFDWKNF
jgi:hypothetical protein